MRAPALGDAQRWLLLPSSSCLAAVDSDTTPCRVLARRSSKDRFAFAADERAALGAAPATEAAPIALEPTPAEAAALKPAETNVPAVPAPRRRGKAQARGPESKESRQLAASLFR